MILRSENQHYLSSRSLNKFAGQSMMDPPLTLAICAAPHHAATKPHAIGWPQMTSLRSTLHCYCSCMKPNTFYR